MVLHLAQKLKVIAYSLPDNQICPYLQGKNVYAVYGIYAFYK